MIAGPNQTDRTLIERYAQHMTTDPKGASALFTDNAELHASGDNVHLRGKAQIHEHLAAAKPSSHKVTAHLQRQGDDNYAEVLTEAPGQTPTISTIRFQTDGHNITKLEMVSSRKA
jgi:predicted DNA-binding protein with PD1-like motif